MRFTFCESFYLVILSNWKLSILCRYICTVNKTIAERHSCHWKAAGHAVMQIWGKCKQSTLVSTVSWIQTWICAPCHGGIHKTCNICRSPYPWNGWKNEYERQASGSGDLLCWSIRLSAVLLRPGAHSDRKHSNTVQKPLWSGKKHLNLHSFVIASCLLLAD